MSKVTQLDDALRPEPFVKVTERMLAAVASGAVSPTALVLYLTMTRHANRKRGDQYVWPSRQTLAAALGLSQVRSVDRYVRELESAGWLKVQRRQEARTRTRNVYSLVGPTGDEMVQKTALCSQTDGAVERTEIVHRTAPSMVQETAPEPDRNQPDRKEPHRRTSSSSGGGKRTTRSEAKQQDEQHAVDLIVRYSDMEELAATSVVSWWRHVGHIKHPGKYAQAIVDDDGEDRLWEVAADILYESAEVAANDVMAELPLPEGVDRDVVANWLTHALSADVPLTHLLPTLFRLADHGVLGTNAYVEAIKQVCPDRAA